MIIRKVIGVNVDLEISSFVLNENKLNSYLCQSMSTISNGIIIIDGDNVRGKTKFTLSKESLCKKVELWKRLSDIKAEIVIMFDHASNHSAFYHFESGIAIVFSGPKLKADDVIARDVIYFQASLECNSSLIGIVTEDSNLKQRCRKNSLSSPSSIRSAKKKFVEVSSSVGKLDCKDYKIMTVDSTKFAEILLQLPTESIPSSFNFENYRFLTHSNMEILDSSSDHLFQTFVEKYKIQIESLLQYECKLYYEKTKLENLISFHKKKKSISRKARTKSQLKVIQKINDIQSKTSKNIDSTTIYLRNWLEQNKHLLPLNNSSKILLYDELISKLKLYNNSDSFPNRASELLDFIRSISSTVINNITLITTNSSNAVLSHPNSKNSQSLPTDKEQTWERVLQAEKLRRDLLLSPNYSSFLKCEDNNHKQTDTTILLKENENLNINGKDSQDSSLSLLSPIEVSKSLPINKIILSKTIDLDTFIEHSLLSINNIDRNNIIKNYVRYINSQQYLKR